MSEEADPYWICEDCADKAKARLKNPTGITVIEGVCSYCHEGPKMMVPRRDFVWPREVLK